MTSVRDECSTWEYVFVHSALQLLVKIQDPTVRSMNNACTGGWGSFFYRLLYMTGEKIRLRSWARTEPQWPFWTFIIVRLTVNTVNGRACTHLEKCISAPGIKGNQAAMDSVCNWRNSLKNKDIWSVPCNPADKQINKVYLKPTQRFLGNECVWNNQSQQA